MAEMVASAVVGETLSRISNFLIDQLEQKPSEKEDQERLEMAHIKMEAALRMSSKWQITEVPMLRWRLKLKRAAQECDSTLRRCKQRAMEDEESRRSSFPKRIARAAKSFVSSFNRCSKAEVDESSSSSSSSSVDIQRLVRFAQGASEFLRFVEFGGTPGRQYTFFNPLVGDLLAGKTLRFRALQGGRLYHLGMRPTRFAERGVEAMVWFAFHDFEESAKSINSRFMLRLSESSDVFGIIIKCLRSATPHFTTAAEDVRRELVQLPTQDFSWVTHFPYAEKEYWVDVHSTLTHWLRPDPLCCNNEHQHDLVAFSNSSTKASSVSRLASLYPEEVIVMYLQCYLEQKNRQRATDNGRTGTAKSGSAVLKLGALFIPHDTPIGVEPAAESYALEVIDGKEQDTVHKNLSLQDVDEMFLPKAMDHLCQNSKSRTYQTCLRSRHGTAYLCVDKTTARARTSGRSKAEGNGMEGWLEVSRDLLKLWEVRTSDKLHGSVKSWIINSPRRN